jgi:hypothetical protein
VGGGFRVWEDVPGDVLDDSSLLPSDSTAGRCGAARGRRTWEAGSGNWGVRTSVGPLAGARRVMSDVKRTFSGLRIPLSCGVGTATCLRGVTGLLKSGIGRETDARRHVAHTPSMMEMASSVSKSRPHFSHSRGLVIELRRAGTLSRLLSPDASGGAHQNGASTGAI